MGALGRLRCNPSRTGRVIRVREISVSPLEASSGERLVVGPECALFLDVDGTLLRIAESPEAVEVSERLCQALRAAAPALGQAVALISGRAIADLDRLFAPLRLPAAGLHGLERRDAGGRLHWLGEAAALDDLRAPLQQFAAEHPGVLLEDKERAVALHYRRAPQAGSAGKRLVRRLLAGRGAELRVLQGKMVIEIKPRLATKGSAIAAFMEEPPFLGRRPVFVGDDVTDEDGFAVVNRLGGYSVRVGSGGRSAARYRLAGVDAVLDWLSDLPVRLDAATHPAAAS